MDRQQGAGARPAASRARTKSGFSFRSDKSDKTDPSHKRKESKSDIMTGKTKANPNFALNEAQPVAAALEEATLVSLQNFRCNDVWGKPIADRDRSNPTRNRDERPLDTIRSFEYQIDRGYNERTSAFMNAQDGMQSRRASSLWQGNNGSQAWGHQESARMSQYGGSNPNQSGYFRRDSYGEGGGYGPPPPNNRFAPRHNASDMALNRHAQQGGVYPLQNNAQSRDTLNTGGSSGSEPWNQSTNPSEQGSMDYGGPGSVKPPGSGYPPGYGAAGQPQYGPLGGQQRSMLDVGPPAPPPKGGMNVQVDRKPAPGGAVQPVKPKQRESWLKKRFSRN